jgi:hypothetical protein
MSAVFSEGIVSGFLWVLTTVAVLASPHKPTR